MSEIRTRFAPSPTGFLHIGGLRTALYSYAFAKSRKGLPAGRQGKFILRIEDTDRRRFVPGATEKIYETLGTFGLRWDEGPYIQSERAGKGIYEKYAKELVDSGHAYYCFCKEKAEAEIIEEHRRKVIILRDESCRNLTADQTEKKIKSGQKAGIRLKVPDKKKISFYDFVIKKEISWETDNIDEVMLLKSDGFPTYHLAVVVDDALMKISHIIRGRDWLPSTPVHLLLFKYLGFKLPQIGHLTDILDPTGGKLSKRKGSVACEDFLAEGYLPEAILNFVMLLGWAPKDNREIFSLKDFVDNFLKGSLQTANPVFNRKKLDWFNGIYLRQKSEEELFNLLKSFAQKGMGDNLINKTIPLVRERMVKLSDYPELVDFLVKEPKIDEKLLVEKGGGDKELIKNQLSIINYQLLVIKDWRAEILEKLFRNLAAKNSWDVSKFFMAVRVTLTGKTISPPLFESMAVLGREKTLRRMKLIANRLS